MQLYDRTGQRKYLTPEEQRVFLNAAEYSPREVQTFCGTLVYTGCRISEALRLTAARIDASSGLLIFETLKKRRKGVFRAVPVPPPPSSLTFSIRSTVSGTCARSAIRVLPRISGTGRAQRDGGVCGK